MAQHTISQPSPYVFVRGSAGAQWGPMAALLRPGEQCLCPDPVGDGSGPHVESDSDRFQQEIAIVDSRPSADLAHALPIHTELVWFANDKAHALPRGAIAAMLI